MNVSGSVQDRAIVAEANALGTSARKMKGRPQQYPTIQSVVAAKLCTSCGTCAGVCPSGAISMSVDKFGIFVPVIDERSCTECGLCVRACPGHEFDYAHFSCRLFGKLPENAVLGSCLETYAGCATDRDVLQLSQSGGFVSTLLLYCLEKGLIDGAVVTRWQADNPLRPETYIARTRDEVLAAVGSKYYPAPAASILRALTAAPGRFAFVGTSCQIQGLRKAEELIPRLSGKIALYVGLHCLGVFTYHFHGQILHKMRLRETDVAVFRDRDDTWRGWPGDMRIVDRCGAVHDLDRHNSRMWPRSYFTSWRCLLCFDKANEFSDVSCGDCRIPGEGDRAAREWGHDMRSGLSDIVVRTERARRLVARLVADGRLVLNAVDPDAVARDLGVAGKKLGLNRFRTVAALFRSGFPEYGVRFGVPDGPRGLRRWLVAAWSTVAAMHYYLVFHLAQYRAFRWCLKRVPHRLLSWLTRKRESRADWVRCATRTRLTREIDGSA